ncbi:MAG: TlpA family protein disulfide reductase, partial [Chloroflexota bacterium]
SLTLFEGQEILTLTDLKGQGVVVNFWASWCIPCRDEMPALEKAYQRYRDVGVVFIGVNLWDEEDKARAFLAEHGVSYPNGMDIADKIADAYNLQGIPTTWFISPDGTVARKALGPVDLDMLDEAIALIRPKQ